MFAGAFHYDPNWRLCSPADPGAPANRDGAVQGDIDSMDWRMHFSESGKKISPWHDIPLSAGGNTYNFVCEIPKETKAKMECALVRHHPQRF